MDARERLRRNREAREQMTEACEQFMARHNPSSVNDEVIQQFLLETEPIDMDQGIKLSVYLANLILDRFGWDEASKVFRYAIQTEGDSYTLWINTGLAFMKDVNQEFEYREALACEGGLHDCCDNTKAESIQLRLNMCTDTSVM